MRFFQSKEPKNLQQLIREQETKEGKKRPIPWRPLYVVGGLTVFFLFIFSCGSVLFFLSGASVNDEGPEPTPRARNASEYVVRGIDFAEEGDFERAVEDFTDAIRLEPEFSSAYYNRGITYEKLQKYREAVQDFTTAIELAPEHQGAHVHRAFTYTLLNLDSEAEADVMRAIELGVDEGELRARLEGARLSRDSSTP